MFLSKGNAEDDKETEELQQDSKMKEMKEALGPLSGRNLQFCTDSCLRRYLEDCDWNVDKSKTMLAETLKWRASFKQEEITWHEVAAGGETGFRANFHDRQGRTVIILRPGIQSTRSIDNQIKHLVYLLENAILNLTEDQEQISFLIDYTGRYLTNNLSIKLLRDIVNIWQNHYPERLAVALLYNPPSLFEPVWKVVKHFLDAKTFQKVKFVYPKNKDSVELMASYFDVDNLPTKFGGKSTLMYDHKEFSEQMAADDVKTAKLWGFDKVAHENSSTEVAPELESLTPTAISAV